MEKLKGLKKTIVFHIIMNGFVLLFVTGASYYHTPLNGVRDTAMYLVHLFLLQATVAGILYFLSIYRIIFYLVFPILYIVYGIIAFWMYSMDISVSPSLIDATLQSKAYIIKDLITFPFFLFSFLQLVSLYIILMCYSTVNKKKGIKFLSVGSIILISIFFIVEKKRYNTFRSRLPYKLYYSFKEYLEEPDLKLLSLDKDNFISKIEDTLNVVLVVGESVRADHLGINGYSRKTTPALSSRLNNIISYKNIYTNKTYTAISVPQILSDMSIYDEGDKKGVRSLFGVLRKSGIYTSWIGNQLIENNYRNIAVSYTHLTLPTTSRV